MSSQSRIRWTIIAMALGAFAIGISEFAAMGLLPYFAADLETTEAVAGHAISSYALGVVIGAPVLAILGARVPRKQMLACLIAAFGAANLAAALAPSMVPLTVARLVGGLPHGAFLGIAMLFAADLLPKGQRARGVAQVLMGLTLANVVGVPAAGALGQAIGWRSCFVIVAALAALSALMIIRIAPYERADPEASPLRELGALRNRAVWLTLGVGAVGFGGVFAIYAYFSAAMIQAAAAPEWAIPLALSSFGVGATFGNVIAGRLASWSRLGGALILLTGMTLAALFYTQAVGSWPQMAAALFMLGGTAGLVVPLQMRLMDVAGHAQSLAAALNHAAFNFANAVGPFLAGLTLTAGYGWHATGWVAAALSTGGVVMLAAAFADARARRRSARPRVATA